MSPDTATDVLPSTTLSAVGKKPMVKRTVFVPEKLWDEAKALADDAESNISTVVRELLERYVKRGGKR